jgi:hypothetical protein
MFQQMLENLFFSRFRVNFLQTKLLRFYLERTKNPLFVEFIFNQILIKQKSNVSLLQKKNLTSQNIIDQYHFKNDIQVLQTDLWSQYLLLWRQEEDQRFLDKIFQKKVSMIEPLSYLKDYKKYILTNKYEQEYFSNVKNTLLLEEQFEYQRNLNFYFLGIFDEISLMYQKNLYIQQKTLRGIFIRFYYETIFPYFSSILFTFFMWLMYLFLIIEIFCGSIAIINYIYIYIYYLIYGNFATLSFETSYSLISIFKIFNEVFFFNYFTIKNLYFLETNFNDYFELICIVSLYYFLFYLLFLNGDILSHEILSFLAIEDENENYNDNYENYNDEINFERLFEILLFSIDFELSNNNANSFHIHSSQNSDFREYQIAFSDIDLFFSKIFFLFLLFLVSQQIDWDVENIEIINEYNDINLSDFTVSDNSIFLQDPVAAHFSYEMMNMHDDLNFYDGYDSTIDDYSQQDSFLSYTNEFDTIYGAYEYPLDYKSILDNHTMEDFRYLTSLILPFPIETQATQALVLPFFDVITENIINNFIFYHFDLSGFEFGIYFLLILLLIYYFYITYLWEFHIYREFRLRDFLTQINFAGWYHSLTNNFSLLDFDILTSQSLYQKYNDKDFLYKNDYFVNEHIRVVNPWIYDSDFENSFIFENLYENLVSKSLMSQVLIESQQVETSPAFIYHKLNQNYITFFEEYMWYEKIDNLDFFNHLDQFNITPDQKIRETYFKENSVFLKELTKNTTTENLSTKLESEEVINEIVSPSNFDFSDTTRQNQKDDDENENTTPIDSFLSYLDDKITFFNNYNENINESLYFVNHPISTTFNLNNKNENNFSVDGFTSIIFNNLTETQCTDLSFGLEEVFFENDISQDLHIVLHNTTVVDNDLNVFFPNEITKPQSFSTIDYNLYYKLDEIQENDSLDDYIAFYDLNKPINLPSMSELNFSETNNPKNFNNITLESFFLYNINNNLRVFLFYFLKVFSNYIIKHSNFVISERNLEKFFFFLNGNNFVFINTFCTYLNSSLNFLQLRIFIKKFLKKPVKDKDTIFFVTESELKKFFMLMLKNFLMVNLKNSGLNVISVIKDNHLFVNLFCDFFFTLFADMSKPNSKPSDLIYNNFSTFYKTMINFDEVNTSSSDLQLYSFVSLDVLEDFEEMLQLIDGLELSDNVEIFSPEDEGSEEEEFEREFQTVDLEDFDDVDPNDEDDLPEYEGDDTFDEDDEEEEEEEQEEFEQAFKHGQISVEDADSDIIPEELFEDHPDVLSDDDVGRHTILEELLSYDKDLFFFRYFFNVTFNDFQYQKELNDVVFTLNNIIIHNKKTLVDDLILSEYLDLYIYFFFSKDFESHFLYQKLINKKLLHKYSTPFSESNELSLKGFPKTYEYYYNNLFLSDIYLKIDDLLLYEFDFEETFYNLEDIFSFDLNILVQKKFLNCENTKLKNNIFLQNIFNTQQELNSLLLTRFDIINENIIYEYDQLFSQNNNINLLLIKNIFAESDYNFFFLFGSNEKKNQKCVENIPNFVFEYDTANYEIDDDELYYQNPYQTPNDRIFLYSFLDNYSLNNSNWLDGWGTWYYLNLNMFDGFLTLNHQRPEFAYSAIEFGSDDVEIFNDDEYEFFLSVDGYSTTDHIPDSNQIKLNFSPGDMEEGILDVSEFYENFDQDLTTLLEDYEEDFVESNFLIEFVRSSIIFLVLIIEIVLLGIFYIYIIPIYIIADENLVDYVYDSDRSDVVRTVLFEGVRPADMVEIVTVYPVVAATDLLAAIYFVISYFINPFLTPFIAKYLRHQLNHTIEYQFILGDIEQYTDMQYNILYETDLFYQQNKQYFFGITEVQDTKLRERFINKNLTNFFFEEDYNAEQRALVRKSRKYDRLRRRSLLINYKIFKVSQFLKPYFYGEFMFFLYSLITFEFFFFDKLFSLWIYVVYFILFFDLLSFDNLILVGIKFYLFLIIQLFWVYDSFYVLYNDANGLLVRIADFKNYFNASKNKYFPVTKHYFFYSFPFLDYLGFSEVFLKKTFTPFSLKPDYTYKYVLYHYPTTYNIANKYFFYNPFLLSVKTIKNLFKLDYLSTHLNLTEINLLGNTAAGRYFVDPLALSPGAKKILPASLTAKKTLYNFFYQNLYFNFRRAELSKSSTPKVLSIQDMNFEYFQKPQITYVIHGIFQFVSEYEFAWDQIIGRVVDVHETIYKVQYFFISTKKKLLIYQKKLIIYHKIYVIIILYYYLLLLQSNEIQFFLFEILKAFIQIFILKSLVFLYCYSYLCIYYDTLIGYLGYGLYLKYYYFCKLDYEIIDYTNLFNYYYYYWNFGTPHTQTHILRENYMMLEHRPDTITNDVSIMDSELFTTTSTDFFLYWF